MGEFVVVQKFDRIAELISDMAHLLHWVGLVVVFSLKELEKKLKIFFDDLS